MTTFELIRNILIGTSLTLLNLLILLRAAKPVIPYLQRELSRYKTERSHRPFVKPVTIMMFFLLLGHLVQFATWALVFVAIGQFKTFAEAFYFSAVNFTSLGYGDIVMDPEWRLLGPLEAANGVLMFGLSAGFLVSLLSLLFRTYTQAHQRDAADQ